MREIKLERGPVAKETMPLLDMDGQEMDLRAEGGFVPIGRMEKADDVPARLSKNEFVFTADAVRNAGEGNVDKGAEVMYNMMKNLEAGGEVSEESQGMDGARKMFQTSTKIRGSIIMAITETRQLPPKFIEDLGVDLGKQIVAQSGVPVVAPGAAGITQLAGESAADFAARQKAGQQFDIRQQSLAGLAPTVAGQDRLQQQAQQVAEAGIGSFQPFLQQAANSRQQQQEQH
jgi:hypothetical protein